MSKKCLDSKVIYRKFTPEVIKHFTYLADFLITHYGITTNKDDGKKKDKKKNN